MACLAPKHGDYLCLFVSKDEPLPQKLQQEIDSNWKFYGQIQQTAQELSRNRN